MAAHIELRSWDRRRARATQAQDIRMAQNGDAKAFAKFLDALERDPA